MDNMELLVENGNGWHCSHTAGKCGGPSALYVGGDLVMADMHAAVDGIRDSRMTTENPRVYHKGGQAIFESDGALPSGHALRQISAYAGNTMRTTWDFHWCKGEALKGTVELCDCLLPGKWEKLTVWNRDFQKETVPLSGDVKRSWSPVPLALVLVRADGQALQISPGFDLWRWDRGLWMTVPPEEQDPVSEPEDGAPSGNPLEESGAAEPPPPVASCAEFSLETTADGVLFRAVVASPVGAATVPLAGDYRFTTLISWSIPGMAGELPVGTAEEIEFGPYACGCRLSRKLLEAPVWSLDFSKMPVCATGIRSDAALPCWESNKTMKAAKKCIRQIAAARSGGVLLLRGFHAAVCREGLHVAKHRAEVHWDLSAIQQFLIWTRQLLGRGWRVVVAEVGDGLPAERGMCLPNGFVYNELEGEDAGA